MECQYDGSYPPDQQGDGAGRAHEKDKNSPSSVGWPFRWRYNSHNKPLSFGNRRNDNCPHSGPYASPYTLASSTNSKRSMPSMARNLTSGVL
jgi:hypothetical protein